MGVRFFKDTYKPDLVLTVNAANHEEPARTHPGIPTAYLKLLKGHRPLSERELRDALIRFANTGSIAARGLLQSGVRWPDSLLARWESLEPRKDPENPIHQPGQIELREALVKVVEGNVSARLLADWNRRAEGLVLLPTSTFEANGERRYRYMAFEQWAGAPQPVIAHALLSLLKGPFRKELCQCKWESCGRFFFRVKPPPGRKGPPIWRYCPDTDHGKRAHDADAVRRVRESRRKPVRQGK